MCDSIHLPNVYDHPHGHESNNRFKGEFLRSTQHELGAATGPRLCCAQVDIHIEVPRLEAILRVGEKLSDDRPGETSAAVRKRVEAARVRQAA
jgi:hypothetical protein